MSVNEFKSRYAEALLDLLWRQWSNLGVAGQIEPGCARYVLDPEALLIFTSRFGRYDQRLYDLVLDWLRVNGAFINIQRLKALAGRMPCCDRHSLGYWAGQLNAGGDRKWRKLAGELQPAAGAAPEEMFLSVEPFPGGFGRVEDEFALSYGFRRNAYRPSGKVTPFPTGAAATVLLQLRGIFGLSARAETVLILLNQDVCKIQEIADRSGFAWKSIQDVLIELCATPLVATGGGKRGRCYFLTSTEKIRALFTVDSFLFPDWVQTFNALAVIWETVSNPRLANLSEMALQSEIDRIFAEEIGEMRLIAGIRELQLLSPTNFESLPEMLERI